MKKSSSKYLVAGVIVVVLIVVGIAFSRHSGSGQTASLFNLGQTTNIKPIGGVTSCPVGTTSTFGYISQWGTRGSGNGQLFEPNGTAVDSSGNVYVVDGANARIQKFSSSGAYITQWGSRGQGNGQFQSPLAIAIDSSGNVYVTDSADNTVQKFSSTGTFITKWGSVGSGNGQFYIPAAIAVAPSGNVYVTDAGDNNQGLPARVEEFSSTGIFIAKWNLAGSNNLGTSPYGIAIDSSGNVYIADAALNTIQKFTSSGTLIMHFGSSGSGNGQLNHPTEIALDVRGNIYVADSKNYRFEEFSPTGAYVGSWGANGSGNGQFEYPFGIAVDSSGNVYVTDTFTASGGNNRVEKFGPTCSSVVIQANQINNKLPPNVITPVSSTCTASQSYKYITQWGSQGSGNGQFGGIMGLAADSSGNIYAADWGNNRIQKFSSTGTYLTRWTVDTPYSVAVDSSGNVYVGEKSGIISKFTSSGTLINSWPLPGNPQGAGPWVAVDSFGNVYATNTNDNKIDKYSPSGTLIVAWGGLGTGNGQFNQIEGIAVGPNGNIYAMDGVNHRIEEFSLAGTYITQWSTPGIGNNGTDIAIDRSGTIYLTDNDNNRIVEFTATGNQITSWGISGTGPGQFTYPEGIAVDASANIYIAEWVGKRIQKFGPCNPSSTPIQIQATQINKLPGGLITSAPVCKIDSFTANPNYFTSTGNSSTLAWTTSDCTSASIMANPATTLTYPNLPVNGSTSSGPLGQTTVFTLTAKGVTNQPVTAQTAVDITLQ